MSQKERDEIAIASFLDTLSAIYTEDNILTSVVTENSVTRFQFESKESIELPTRMIINSTLDTSAWLATLEFLDETSLELGYIGSILEIETKEYEHSDLVPLVGLVDVSVPYRGILAYSVIGKHGPSSDLSSMPINVSKGAHKIPILGLYEELTNQIELRYSNKDGALRFTEAVTITTDSYEDHLPGSITVVENLKPDHQRLFLTAHRACRRNPDHSSLKNSSVPFIFDQYGDVRWFAISDATYALQQTTAGTILFVSNVDEFTELSLNGKMYNVYEVPAPYTGIHHDIVDLDNGQVILTVNDQELDTIEDVLILFDKESGLVERKWDLNNVPPKSDIFIKDDHDWFHANAVDYDFRDNSLIVSGQRFGIVKLSWENNLEWILTDPQRLGDALYDDRYHDTLLTTATGETVTWGQHDIRIDEGNNVYYLFDNGLGRNYSNVDLYSRGIRFSVKPEEKTYELVTQFGENRLQYYSPIISGIDYSESGYTLVNFGSIGYDLNYVSNEDWIGNIYKEYPSIGAAWLEFDANDELITDIQFSCLDERGRDHGIYRGRYVNYFPH